jgi:diguanylate cyclase (GGDEF)-like protein
VRARAVAELRLGLLTVLLVGLGSTLWWTDLASRAPHPDAPFHIPVLVLLAAFVAVEFTSLHVESRGDAHSITFSEVPLVVGLLLSTPGEVAIARLVAGVLVLGLVRRQGLSKLSINLSMFFAEVAVAAAVLHTIIDGRVPIDPAAWWGVFGGLLAAHLLGVLAVTMAITLHSGWPSIELIRQVVLFGTASCLANTAIGLALVGSVWSGAYGGFLFALVALVLYMVYRAYTALRERHKSLETLHDFTRTLGGSVELDEVEQAVLLGARSILRAEQGALLLPPVREGQPATRLFADGDEISRVDLSPTELAADLTVLLPDGEARLLAAGQPLPPWLAAIGVTDGVVVPIVAEGMAQGAMVVVNRLTEVATFVEDDLRVFQTLANHGGVALENGRLVATLQHEAAEKAYQALHDPVTGLPNRASLTEQLGAAIIDARMASAHAALVFVDLDTFKEVNDTLGTATGDRLLREVRDRLLPLLPSGATLARFHGDVFAVLLAEVGEHQEVLALAEVLHSAFDAPFTDDAVSLVLGASLGIAFYPEHATTADLLLQRADAATYTARQEGSGIEVYRQEADPYAPRRLALAADLREALERDEVDVFVQPKMSLADGTVRGAEALVRWTHHRQGPLSPDQFIPAAEHTGVIRGLTLYVVRGALGQCRRWRDAGHDLTVSVNLSGRSLFDSHLVDDIGELIADAGVPASTLTLELTESTVMGESHRSLEVLDGLHELGVGISVDDFGTGYSSLSHLRRLPITELKIDKSFVGTMTLDEHDAVIVRTLVELGRNLGLRTVAEGVESQDAWDLLADMGCDEAQGYLMSRPLPADQFTTWLGRQRVAALAAPEGVVELRRPPRSTGTGTGDR